MELSEMFIADCPRTVRTKRSADCPHKTIRGQSADRVRIIARSWSEGRPRALGEGGVAAGWMPRARRWRGSLALREARRSALLTSWQAIHVVWHHISSHTVKG
eukprot:355546-Chlamydomonas_euryale.AAC.7